ncbi:acyl-CoA dehydrogenase family protein [Brevibacterium sp. 91QC2O2]|uniref:acyl-CoA dehydrogenase family protein n=1 Tax=Brevibacterium sp. 91QC2O2 TaxID=2968458 RepID=UPI00211BAD4D|nr:acyl-CoA dehydrogenase family protein [Brevibacterium sp. 91QC2O2]MCQ9368052.1 acyl-CoA dehydrogenase family protein [Brevibacterium sp. 91QC2O2]
MDLELTDIQQELGATVARLLKDKYDASAREAILASELGYSEEIWQQFAELGLTSLTIPEEFGGAGMGFGEVAVVMEEFGKALVLEPYVPTVILGAGLVEALGTDAQKEEILPAVAEGAKKLAFAGYEPLARYELASPSTTFADGVLNGEKVSVWGGDAADTFIVSANNDGVLSLFLVDAAAAGVTVDPRRQADGLGSAAVLFENAPATPLGAGDPSAALEYVIDTANAALAAEAVGAMESALAMTADYLKTREQFGVAIGTFQSLQFRASECYALLEDARSMALYAKLAIVQDPDGTSKERHRDVLAAKLVIDSSSRHIMQESIQLHGGIGMTMEYPIGHYAKRLTVIPRTFDEQGTVNQELADLGGLVEPAAADL